MTATFAPAPSARTQDSLSQEASKASRELSREAQLASLMAQFDPALDARRKSSRPASAEPATAPSPQGAVPFVAMPDLGEMNRAELEAFFARANPADPRYDPAWAQAQAEHGLEQIATRSAPAAYPRERGRFTAGNPGGPGRPRKPRTVQQDIVTLVANRISDEAWGEMTDTAVLQAIEGDNSARRWLFQMLFKNGALNDAAAVAASGLSEDEHRLHLARERYGQAMAAAEAARAALEAELVQHAEPTAPEMVAPEAATPTAAPAEQPQPDAQHSTAQTGTQPESRPDAEEPAQAPRGTLPATDRTAAPQPPRGPAENGKKRSKTVENGRQQGNGTTSLERWKTCQSA